MGDRPELSMIKPLYLKDSDIQCFENDRITDYDLMDCLTNVVGDSLHCLQLDRNYGEYTLAVVQVAKSS